MTLAPQARLRPFGPRREPLCTSLVRQDGISGVSAKRRCFRRFRGSVCPGYSASNVRAEFAIPKASSYRNFLPKMGRTPELDADSSPAYLVIFRGTVSTGRGLVEDAVCVVQSDGTANLYGGVSRVGILLPEGAVSASS